MSDTVSLRGSGMFKEGSLDKRRVVKDMGVLELWSVFLTKYLPPSLSLYIYIYIPVGRERERERHL